MNCTHRITIIDVMLITSYALGLISEFPCSPTPTPTPTPTPIPTPTPFPTPTPTPTPIPTPTPVPDPITLNKEGTGSGSILVNGAVVCDPACTSTQIPYKAGATYVIDALPEPDSVLDGWKLNGILVSGTITVQSGDTVTAIFTRIPPPTADFTAAPVRGYAPLTVVFSNTSTGNITGYAWDFGDGQSSPDPNPTHVYETAGWYSVSLTATARGARIP